MANEKRVLTVEPQQPSTEEKKQNPFAQTKKEIVTEDLEEYVATGHATPAFQSEEAQKEFERLSAPKPDAEPVMGMVSNAQQLPRQVIVANKEDKQKMVRCKPRVTIPRFRVGTEWFQVRAGQPTVLPKHVVELLEQKGAL